MASTKKTTTAAQPLDAAEIQQRINAARKLAALSAEFARKSQLNADLARVGLSELETDLATRGVAREGGAA